MRIASRSRLLVAALAATAAWLLPSLALAHASTLPDRGARKLPGEWGAPLAWLPGALTALQSARAAGTTGATRAAGAAGTTGATGEASMAMRRGRARRQGATPILVIHGAGDGHGVGMSQQGALGYARHGWSYAAILAHYYTGTSLGIAPRGKKVRVLIGGSVKRIPLERYVRGVVAAEMPAEWPMAALEAQAVATRTYALTAHAGGARFDVYADSRSQVYEGRAAETPRTNAAVAATARQVVTYRGRPVTTYFFASSGGLTEAIQNAFPGSPPEPWLRGVEDAYERGGLHRWTLTLSFARATADLAGLVPGSLRGIEVLARGYSPRIVRAELLGSRGSAEVSGPELAARLHLYSTWAYFSIRGPDGTHREPDRSHYKPPPAEAPGAPPAAGGQPGAPPQGGGSPAPGATSGGVTG